MTFFQSHSSSSATSCARPVMVPWPISERAMRITQVSSGRIEHPGVDFDAVGGGLGFGDAERQVEAERQAAGRRSADHEGAARNGGGAKVGDWLCHGALPP